MRRSRKQLSQALPPVSQLQGSSQFSNSSSLISPLPLSIRSPTTSLPCDGVQGAIGTARSSYMRPAEDTYRLAALGIVKRTKGGSPTCRAYGWLCLALPVIPLHSSGPP